MTSLRSEPLHATVEGSSTNKNLPLSQVGSGKSPQPAALLRERFVWLHRHTTNMWR
jgi:hypothetical protein